MSYAISIAFAIATTAAARTINDPKATTPCEAVFCAPIPHEMRNEPNTYANPICPKFTILILYGAANGIRTRIILSEKQGS